jgi:hypothetical protein
MDWIFISPQKKIPMTTYRYLLKATGVGMRVVKQTLEFHLLLRSSLLCNCILDGSEANRESFCLFISAFNYTRKGEKATHRVEKEGITVKNLPQRNRLRNRSSVSL